MFWAIFAVLIILAALNLVLLSRLRLRDQSESRLREQSERLREDLARMAQRQSDESRALREEVAAGIQRFAGQSAAQMVDAERNQRAEFDRIRETIGRRLDEMRATVDEKLQSTLETRLGESFRLVSERLEQVHRGLGEMQRLAAGVGDLKRVLGNVTTRGAWGEVQLENLLTQMLAPGQFDRNVSPTGTGERVEFAIRLPGRDSSTPVWLPIDAKFPLEAWQRLSAAAERGDKEAVEVCSKELETVVRHCAKSISTKYLAPPLTTDFGILFLATEGLYAEVLRRPGFAENLQTDYRVVLAGPTTFSALLNSLQMGFRTLAIEQRSSEVWKVLGEVKLEFGRYARLLDSVRKKLDLAVATVDDAAVRTRAIERRLKDVEVAEIDAPSDDAQGNLLRLAAG
jgi:DNA recombination protein RmuC